MGPEAVEDQSPVKGKMSSRLSKKIDSSARWVVECWVTSGHCRVVDRQCALVSHSTTLRMRSCSEIVSCHPIVASNMRLNFEIIGIPNR